MLPISFIAQVIGFHPAGPALGPYLKELKLSQADSAPAEWWHEEDPGVGYKISVLSHQLGSFLFHQQRFLT